MTVLQKAIIAIVSASCFYLIYTQEIANLQQEPYQLRHVLNTCYPYFYLFFNEKTIAILENRYNNATPENREEDRVLDILIETLKDEAPYYSDETIEKISPYAYAQASLFCAYAECTACDQIEELIERLPLDPYSIFLHKPPLKALTPQETTEIELIRSTLEKRLQDLALRWYILQSKQKK